MSDQPISAEYTFTVSIHWRDGDPKRPYLVARVSDLFRAFGIEWPQDQPEPTGEGNTPLHAIHALTTRLLATEPPDR